MNTAELIENARVCLKDGLVLLDAAEKVSCPVRKRDLLATAFGDVKVASEEINRARKSLPES